MAFATPLQMNGKSKDGKVLYGSTLLKERTLRSNALIEQQVTRNDENTEAREEYKGSLARQSSRRERVLA